MSMNNNITASSSSCRTDISCTNLSSHDINDISKPVISQGSPSTSSIRAFSSLSRDDFQSCVPFYDTCLQNTNYRLPILRKRKANLQEKQEIMGRVKSDWHSNELAWRKSLEAQEEFTQIRGVRTKLGCYEYFDMATDKPVSVEEYQARYQQYLLQRRAGIGAVSGNSCRTDNSASETEKENVKTISNEKSQPVSALSPSRSSNPEVDSSGRAISEGRSRSPLRSNESHSANHVRLLSLENDANH